MRLDKEFGRGGNPGLVSRLHNPTQELQLKLRVQGTRANCTRLVCIALTQSLDPEQPGLCLFYIKVVSSVTVVWCIVGKDSFHQR